MPELNDFVVTDSSVELCCQVSTGAIDAAIVVEPPFAVDKSCAGCVLVADPLVGAPPELAGRDAHELLRSEPFIRYDRSVLGGQLAYRYLRDQGLRPRQRLEIDGLMAVAALWHEVWGGGLLPEGAPFWPSGLAIARIALQPRASVRHVGLVWGEKGARASLARAFLPRAHPDFAMPAQARPADELSRKPDR